MKEWVTNVAIVNRLSSFVIFASGTVSPTFEPDERVNKKLSRNGKCLPGEDRKMMTIKLDTDDMEHSKQGVKHTMTVKPYQVIIMKKRHRIFCSVHEKKGLYCSVHKKGGMVVVKHAKCEHEECKKIPNFNYENETKRLYCSVHKKGGRQIKFTSDKIFGLKI